MALEIQDWLTKVIEEKPEKDVQKLVDDLALPVGRINLVYVFDKAQELAGKIRDEKGQIPDDLVQAIQKISVKPSGFTGLTVWEAWLGFHGGRYKS